MQLCRFQKVRKTDNSSTYSSGIIVLRIFLALFSVSYNTYLYIIFNPMFRQGFKNILCFWRTRQPVSNVPWIVTKARTPTTRVQLEPRVASHM